MSSIEENVFKNNARQRLISGIRSGEIGLETVQNEIPHVYDIGDTIWDFPSIYIKLEVFDYLADIYPFENMSEKHFRNYIYTCIQIKNPSWNDITFKIENYNGSFSLSILEKIMYKHFLQDSTESANYANVASIIHLIDICLEKTVGVDLMNMYLDTIYYIYDLESVSLYEMLFEPFSSRGLKFSLGDLSNYDFDTVYCCEAHIDFLCTQIDPESIGKMLALHMANNEAINGFNAYNTIKILAKNGVNFEKTFN
jgi:hypothetical protein